MLSVAFVFLQVYSAINVELVTKTRTEHLSDQDKTRNKGKTYLNFLQLCFLAGSTPHKFCKLFSCTPTPLESVTHLHVMFSGSCYPLASSNLSSLVMPWNKDSPLFLRALFSHHLQQASFLQAREQILQKVDVYKEFWEDIKWGEVSRSL